MNISQTTLRIGAVLGTIGAIVVLAASAQAATSKPAGMSQAEYALIVRSEALNKLYGLDRTNQPTKAASAQTAASKPAGMSQAEYALMVRSQALNKLYGLDRTSQPTKVVEQPTGSGNGFGWGEFGIGAAALLVLLSGGLLAGAYFGRKAGVRPRSVS